MEEQPMPIRPLSPEQLECEEEERQAAIRALYGFQLSVYLRGIVDAAIASKLPVGWPISMQEVGRELCLVGFSPGSKLITLAKEIWSDRPSSLK